MLLMLAYYVDQFCYEVMHRMDLDLVVLLCGEVPSYDTALGVSATTLASVST